ncbi:sugar ABC transporter ATP-binding protein [Isoptericola sp. b441]|uniref:Sugar ABC transporter ATP-binding protein n=1 Tax=Actinotalea lenta TaxID=3064654 RepID=A0ABT9D622_9CELL|nr:MULTISPECIES: sugar ABC transporter ATP-binding protein [unclassified Isoptericola]MDO8105579.1 sugar ABC transporter ATP-binding protein [Isoptericola sp. b441]MDO8122699.1 sugar ABC transporter ATP-binding protein [Isoptericola sp. b490]
MPAPAAVRMTGIRKSFDGVTVLDDVEFEVEAAEVHALAGGNGAGKSTLMKILQGVYQRDAGRVELFGDPVTATTIQAARAAGIGMVFQEFSLIPTLTVAQNIFLDDEPTRSGLIDDAAMRARSAEILARIGVAIDPGTEVGDLSTAQWQLTEIAKALRQDARVLIMDEPTASLAKHEVDSLFELIARLKAQGIAVIYISHRMDEVYRIADRITILRNGRNLLTARLDQVTPQEIVAGIAGKELAAAGARGPRVEIADAPPLLEVQDVRAPGVEGATFDVRAGEVVGIAGLMGAGRTELARALFGVTRITGGGLRMHGSPVSLDSPADAIASGIALIPEDRRLQGLVLDHSVRENLTLPVLTGMRRWGLLVADRIRSVSDELIERFHIAVARPDAPARLLSGGNQQKIVIAKWLGTDPEVLVMDEPTAGVDVGTKSEIVRIVRELARTGKGIVVISSEYPELIAMCDRFLIMRAGRIVDSIDADSIQTEVDLELAVQGLAA